MRKQYSKKTNGIIRLRQTKLFKPLIASSLALTLSSSVASALSIDLHGADKTGLWRNTFHTGGGEWYDNIFSFTSTGGINVAVYEKNKSGFAPYNTSESTKTISNLTVKLRPKTYRENLNWGGASWAAANLVDSYYAPGSEKMHLIIGSYQTAGIGVSNQDPTLYVKSGDDLKVGSSQDISQGIVFDYAKFDGNTLGMQNLNTTIQFKIDGNFTGNIKAKTQSNDPAGSLIVHGLANGRMSSIITLENKTEQLNFGEYTGNYNSLFIKEVVSGKKINRFEIHTYGAANDKNNPLVFISRSNAATMIDMYGQYGGGDGLVIADEGSMQGKNRTNPTLVRSMNQNGITFGHLIAGNNGTVVIANMNGGTVRNFGFGHYDGKNLSGKTSNGLIIIQNDGTFNYTGQVTSSDSNNEINLLDASAGKGRGVFNFSGDVNNSAKWNVLVTKDTKINLSNKDTFSFAKIWNKPSNAEAPFPGAPTLPMVVEASNTKITIDRNKRTKTTLNIGNKDTQYGLDERVINGGLTIETNINNNQADLVNIANTLGYSRPTKTITLIPRTRSDQDYKQHKGQVVGYTPYTLGNVNFEKVVKWKADDRILNKPFVITLEATQHDSQYTKWTIKDYRLEGEVDPTPPEPEKPDPEPNPNPPVDPNPPINPPVDPEPNPPVDPNPPVNPPEGGETEKPNPPKDPSFGGFDPDPDFSQDMESPFEQDFIATMATRIGDTKNLFLANFNSINKRLGELRGSDKEHGVWARTFVGGYSNSTFFTLQAGYDNMLIRSKDFSLYVGAAIAYSKDNVTDMGELAFYTSFVQDSGWYNDTIMKVAFMNSKSLVETFDHYGFVLSDEVGYRFRIGQFFIDPQVELSLGYLSGADFKDRFNGSPINASFSDTIHFRGRFGASGGYDYVAKEDLKIQAYLGLFGEADKFSKSSGSIGAYALVDNYGSAYTDDVRMVLNVGTNIDWKDNGKIYFDFEKSFFGKFNIDWKVNVGYRYAFGEKKMLVEEKEEKAPLKLKEEEEKSKENTK